MQTNTKWFLLYWIVVAILFIFMAVGCGKDLDPLVNVDCDCGIVTSNTNNDTLWTVSIRNNCSGIVETSVFYFPLDEYRVGDEICDLKHIEIPYQAYRAAYDSGYTQDSFSEWMDNDSGND